MAWSTFLNFMNNKGERNQQSENEEREKVSKTLSRWKGMLHVEKGVTGWKRNTKEARLEMGSPGPAPRCLSSRSSFYSDHCPQSLKKTSVSTSNTCLSSSSIPIFTRFLPPRYKSTFLHRLEHALIHYDRILFIVRWAIKLFRRQRFRNAGSAVRKVKNNIGRGEQKRNEADCPRQEQMMYTKSFHVHSVVQFDLFAFIVLIEQFHRPTNNWWKWKKIL